MKNKQKTYLAGLACLSGATALYAQEPQMKPNIIMILADDLGWMDTSFTGSRLYETPNIERLAKRGMFFPNAYSASPLCSPTRASIMTGQNPARVGITSPACHVPQVILAPSAKSQAAAFRRAADRGTVTRLNTDYYTLAEGLKDAGYTTGHFGKWHLGAEPYSPLEHGFDVDIPHWPGPGPAGSFVAPWKFPNFKPRTPKEHIEDRMGDEAVAFMTKHASAGSAQAKPFYLNYWQFSVHAPFDAKKDYIDDYKPKIDPKYPQRSPTYAAMVKSLDDNVGKIMDALDDLGIADNTIIIFYSDNGGNMYDRVDGTTPTSNAPLRGGKASIYEGGIRVPAIVVWPGVVEPDSRNDALVQSEDLYPTILEMAGAPRKEDQPCDGVSMLPALKGTEGLREAIYSFFPHSPPVPDWMSPSVCVRKGNWKLIRAFHDAADQSQRYELYNLAEDIGERNNLAEKEPARVKELDALIETFLQDTEAVTPKANEDYDPKARASLSGWQVGDGGYGIITFNRRMKTMQARALEDDMVLTTTEPLDLPAGTYTLRIRMESYSREGNGSVSVGGNSVSIPTRHDRHFHDYAVAIESPGGRQHLTFSPCTKPGTTQIESIQLLDSAGKTLKSWTFGQNPKSPKRTGKKQKAVSGWVGGANGNLALSLKADGLHGISTGGDPMLICSSPLDHPAGTYQCVIRLRSQAKGDGQVFARPKSRSYQAGTGHPFTVKHDGQWQDYRIEMKIDHDIHEIRLDTCTGPGQFDIQWIRLESKDGTIAKEWNFRDR